MEAAVIPVRRERPVRFVALERQHTLIELKLHGAFVRLLCSSAFTLGEEVERFEAEFAACAHPRCTSIPPGAAVRSSTAKFRTQNRGPPRSCRSRCTQICCPGRSSASLRPCTGPFRARGEQRRRRAEDRFSDCRIRTFQAHAARLSAQAVAAPAPARVTPPPGFHKSSVWLIATTSRRRDHAASALSCRS